MRNETLIQKKRNIVDKKRQRLKSLAGTLKIITTIDNNIFKMLSEDRSRGVATWLQKLLKLILEIITVLEHDDEVSIVWYRTMLQAVALSSYFNLLRMAPITSYLNSSKENLTKESFSLFEHDIDTLIANLKFVKKAWQENSPLLTKKQLQGNPLKPHVSYWNTHLEKKVFDIFIKNALLLKAAVYYNAAEDHIKTLKECVQVKLPQETNKEKDDVLSFLKKAAHFYGEVNDFKAQAQTFELMASFLHWIDSQNQKTSSVSRKRSGSCFFNQETSLSNPKRRKESASDSSLEKNMVTQLDTPIPTLGNKQN